MRGPVLLTGGSGFLGSHIADALAARGVAIRALVRRTSDVRHLSSLPETTLVYGSLEDGDALSEAVRGARGVIHAAGLIKAVRPRDFARVNDGGTARLLDAARAAAPALERFVYVSSLAAQGPSLDGRPRSPGATPDPVTAYGRSKLAAEERVRAAADDVPTVVIRPAVVHGPRDRETLAFFQAVKWGVLPLTGAPDAVLSMVYATDCADACVRAIDADVASGSAYDIEDGRPETLATIVGHIEAAMGRRVRVRVPIPEALLRVAAGVTYAFGRAVGRAVMFTPDKVNELRAPHWVSDASGARAALGWTPRVPFSEGAKLSAAWYKKAGWL
jgi:nucleoside-diphosphate-sugar epimerase